MSSTVRSPERGAAMLLTLTLLVMAGIAFALDSLLLKSSRVKDDARAFRQLSQAKEALLSYAGANDRVAQLGRLPCPFLGNIADYDSDGTSGACGGDNLLALGLLPWKTLGLPNLRDGSFAPIVYAVAGAYKLGSTTATPPFPTGNLTLNNSGDHVAFLIAPGDPLSNQTRLLSSTLISQRTQFLEKVAATPDTDFELRKIDLASSTPVANRFNDRLLAVSQNDLIYAVTRN
ncbi:MAG: hypothetical protein HQL56_10900 [Magnetococcales bacterium]|nr:hypothetical protein [Magnetococcales bacterium]